MKFHLLYAGTMTATFELDNKSVYFSEKPYDVFLGNNKAIEGQKANVFTLYELEPDCEYKVRIEEDEVTFRTKKASMILHISEFRNLSSVKNDNLMFQTAINVLPPDGVLYIDKGDYHITSLFLKSNMTLYLAKGAVIHGDTDMRAYPVIPGEHKYLDETKKPCQFVTWEGNPFPTSPSFLNAFYCENIDVAGEGIIDGEAENSDFWVDVKKMKIGRPRMIFTNRCKNLNFIGLRIQNSPAWTVHPYFSDHLGFYDLKISNPKDAPNTDGMDPEACKDVKIIGVYFSVGDDCIALKSGKIYIGKTYKKPCENVTIRNCYMHEGHGAVVLGSEIGAGIKDVSIERCYFEHTDRGLRIKTRRGRGEDSKIDGVVFRHIIMDHVLTPLVINMFYFCDPDGHTEYVWSQKKLPVDERTPYMGSFVFDDIRCTDAEWALGWFYGLPEMPIKSVTIRNSSFTMKKDASKGRPAMMDGIEEQSKAGFVFSNVGNVSIENVKASGYVGDEFVLKNVRNFEEN